LPEPTQTAKKAASCNKIQQAVSLLFIRFAFAIYEDLSQLSLRFYYGAAYCH